MSEEEAVRHANRIFYDAFAAGDYTAMDRLWATTAPVACIHPGWAPLIGRGPVMASWQAILAKPPTLKMSDDSVLLQGGAAIVLCREHVGSAALAATNLFVREDGGWRMTHHQAGPIAGSSPDPTSQRLH